MVILLLMPLGLLFLLAKMLPITLTYPSLVFGQVDREDSDFTINSTNNNNILANLTAEAEIPPYSSFVLIAYCHPGSLDLTECKTLIFPVLTEQSDIIQ
jgi:hypothetical protein